MQYKPKYSHTEAAVVYEDKPYKSKTTGKVYTQRVPVLKKIKR